MVQPAASFYLEQSNKSSSEELTIATYMSHHHSREFKFRNNLQNPSKWDIIVAPSRAGYSTNKLKSLEIARRMHLAQNLLFNRSTMIREEIIKVIATFQALARRLPDTVYMLMHGYESFDKMCYRLAKKNGFFIYKPVVCITATSESVANNYYFRGKSICSKSQREIGVLSLEKLSEFIALPKRFEEDVRNRLLVEKIMALLTQRQRQVALGIMQGSTEVQIASSLGISRQRVNEIKKRIREKAIKILDKGLCS